MARVGIDLDGVVYDFAASVREHLTRTGYEVERCTPPTRWEFYEDWGLSLAEFLQVAADGVDAGVIFTHGDPFPGTREALQQLRDAGHTLHVITDRMMGSPGRAAAATITWLTEHGLPFDSVTFSADKTIVATDYMIDDKLANYDALAKVGCQVWLFDRPWNQVPAFCGRYRVKSLGEFVEKVLR